MNHLSGTPSTTVESSRFAVFIVILKVFYNIFVYIDKKGAHGAPWAPPIGIIFTTRLKT